MKTTYLPLVASLALCACQLETPPTNLDCPIEPTLDYLKQESLLLENAQAQWQGQADAITFYTSRYLQDQGLDSFDTADPCWQDIQGRFDQSQGELWLLK